jgi:hypothetical protein
MREEGVADLESLQTSAARRDLSAPPAQKTLRGPVRRIVNLLETDVNQTCSPQTHAAEVRWECIDSLSVTSLRFAKKFWRKLSAES